MDIRKINQDLIQFWDQQFGQAKASRIEKKDIPLDNDLVKLIKFVGDRSEIILDYGTGSGYALIAAKLHGRKMKSGLGIDPSSNSIKLAKDIVSMSQIEGLEFKVGKEEYLDQIEDHAFDAIICSNVLDVIPYETSSKIIEEFSRIIKPKGYFLLKINFYLTDELIKKIKMEKIGDNAYALNGILRGVNLSNKEWVERFNGFSVIEEKSYQRLEKGPMDRVILFRKNE
jgi:ubiquinone/menaquinone biosynthesis C-methylase UbiE